MSFGTGSGIAAACCARPGCTRIAAARHRDRHGHRVAVRACGDLRPEGLAIGWIPAKACSPSAARCPAPVVRAFGERLPFADGSFDMISMGYGLRHVADLRALFDECNRVLAPGGRIVVLELTQPDSRIARSLNRVYMRTIVPGLASFSKVSPRDG